uniref:Uncharacterized protein n=1 Tax=Aegilops tauschii subsp. strangulata TaxID=200361 RepID=A0A453R6N4_AEGTS
MEDRTQGGLLPVALPWSSRPVALPWSSLPSRGLRRVRQELVASSHGSLPLLDAAMEDRTQGGLLPELAASATRSRDPPLPGPCTSGGCGGWPAMRSSASGQWRHGSRALGRRGQRVGLQTTG